MSIILCRKHLMDIWLSTKRRQSTTMRRQNNYSSWDRLWSAGISKLGNLSFFDDGYGTPRQLRFFKNKIELIKSLNVDAYVQSCKQTIQLDRKKIDGNIILVEGRNQKSFNLQ